MKIGIVCYASVGGSGVVATELAHALASRGHEVHLISSDLPFRWRPTSGLSFTRVETPAYPLFREPQYLLGLTNTLVGVSRARDLDIIHAHYAVPHATAAYLAQQILVTEAPHRAPRTVTTLHGTDITLVGSDPSYAGVVAFSIRRSNGVTTVSESLKRETIRSLGIESDVRVIPNFLDCTHYRRRPDAQLRERFCPAEGCDAVVMHVSNFRPVKRSEIVLDIFREIRRQVRARLVFVGDGPDRAAVERRAIEYGLRGDVDFVGEQFDLVPWLSIADVLLLPSAQESFGMAALEAMSCEVAVVASDVGGLPEVIDDGRTGFLCPMEATELMAERAMALLKDPAMRTAITQAAAVEVRDRFCEERVVPMYEAYYRDVARPAL
jgi:L-malate glycosyltransferase